MSDYSIHGGYDPVPADDGDPTTRQPLNLWWRAFVSFFACLVIFVVGFTEGHFWSAQQANNIAPLPVFQIENGRTLVVMVHFAKDELYSSSLNYFVHKAIRCWQDADYRIIIQRDDANTLKNSSDWMSGLPSLPHNARYILHQNECMDWGSVGWLFRLPANHTDAVDTSRYRYFVILNSSVKGPILPSYLEAAMDSGSTITCDDSPPKYVFSWFHVFLSRLDSVTRYVGCTWSCAQRIHIQSYVVAFDFVALQVLWQNEGSITEDYTKWMGIQSLNASNKVFGCWPSYWDVVINSEIGASQAILSAGYNVGSMQRVYWGKDFRVVNVCLGVPSSDPTLAGGLVLLPDGTSVGYQPLDPLEVVFVKHKHRVHSSDASRDALLAIEGYKI